jgi:hypothetical protein
MPIPFDVRKARVRLAARRGVLLAAYIETTGRAIKPDFRLWHFSAVPTALSNVGFRGQTGKHFLVLSITGFDPDLT